MWTNFLVMLFVALLTFCTLLIGFYSGKLTNRAAPHKDLEKMLSRVNRAESQKLELNIKLAENNASIFALTEDLRTTVTLANHALDENDQLRLENATLHLQLSSLEKKDGLS